MRAKFLKKVWVAILSACLVLSQAVVSFADTEGVMEPDDYVFFTVFMACGIPVQKEYIGCWMGAYKGYLESTHNNALLSQVNSYSDLSWGDTAHGIDTLFKSVKSWLSLSGSYGTTARYYSLPSSALPLWPGCSLDYDSSEPRVSSCKADVSCNDPNYVYSFSVISHYDSSGYVLTNYYVPKGQEIIGCCSGAALPYADRLDVKFYARSGSGFSPASIRSNHCMYDSAGKLTYSSSELASPDSIRYLRVGTVMTLPFKVFCNTTDIRNYFETGNAGNVFSSGGCLLVSRSLSSFQTKIQRVDGCQVGESLSIPDSGAAGKLLNDMWNSGDEKKFMSAMNSSGMNITYNVPYKLGHYTQKYSADGTYKWEKVSETSHTGAAGKPALIKTSEFPGFTYSPELVPEEKTVLLDGSLEVPVYYTCDPVSYKVEHYKESFSGDEKSWKLADTETLQGLPGVDAKYSAKGYPGYSFDASLTKPSNCQVLADGSLVIRLYYTCDPVPYKVEHYKESFSGDEKSWLPADTETLQGIPGMNAKYSAKEYPGYSFGSGLTEPSNCQVLPDGSLVIRLYYTCDPVPFTVEYYKESFIPSGDKKSWLPAGTETLQGIPGTWAKYPVKEYPGYSFDASLTEPSSCQVLPDGSLVIRLYYTQAPFSVLTEPVNKAAGSSLPVAAVVGSVLSGGLFLLKLYKRISAKA